MYDRFTTLNSASSTAMLFSNRGYPAGYGLRLSSEEHYPRGHDINILGRFEHKLPRLFDFQAGSQLPPGQLPCLRRSPSVTFRPANKWSHELPSHHAAYASIPHSECQEAFRTCNWVQGFSGGLWRKYVNRNIYFVRRLAFLQYAYKCTYAGFI